MDDPVRWMHGPGHPRLRSILRSAPLRSLAPLTAVVGAVLLTAGCAAVQTSAGTCTADEDCDPGSICSGGLCLLRECSGEVGCSIAESCLDGRCVPLHCPARRCPPGLFCIDGRCLPPECSNVSCPDGQACAQGECLPVACGGEVDGGCGSEEVCVDGGCLAQSCVGVSCPEGQRCANGECFPQD
ncbi:MAG: hypothetical protein FJ125_14365, partial [Deltaproteobacteria bacterium]|nr:hypothetical protein [Deltaproteobacteria bacterium]